MNRKTSLFLPLVIAIFTALTAHAQGLHPYSASVGNFVGLKVKGGIPVNYVYSTDSAGIVTFNADEATSQAIVFENKKGILTVSLDPKLYNLYHNIPVVTVRSNHLNAVTNEGDSTVTVMSTNSTATFEAKVLGKGYLSVRNIDANEVKASLRGGKGTLSIAGTCEAADLSNTGQGTIQAGLLKANSVKCTLSGSGKIDCYAKVNLTVKGVGTGTVYYAGSPSNIESHVVKLKLVNMEADQ